MKKYIKPIVEIEHTGLEGSLLVGKQSKPEQGPGSGDIFVNQGGYDDDLFDRYEKPGGIWDDEQEDNV